MKKTTITMLCLAACFAAADTRITWLADVTADRAETVTGAQSNQIHDAAAHIVRADNPHGVTAAQIGALTNELDLAALRTFHYGSPDIVESPAEWFVFDGAETITSFNWAEGRTNVVIPWAIGGVPVTAIGAESFGTRGIVSLIAPQTVTSIGPSAFDSCGSLTYVSTPQAQTVGAYAFYYCTSLTYVSLPQAQTAGDFAFGYDTSLTSVYFDDDAPAIGANIFAGITPNQVTIYVTNQTATGWGETFGGMPVVRLPLYADAIYQAGELVATTQYVAQAIASQLPGIVYSNSVSALTIYTNASGAATSWWQVASGVTNSGSFASGTPGAITNGQTGPLTLGSMTILANGNVGLEGNSTPSKPLEFASTTGEKIVLYKNGGYSLGVEGNEMRYNITGSLGRYTFNRGTAYATPNELFRVGPTLGIHTPGYVGIGPTISGKQAHIFTDGTNCYFVNVHSVTNALTTN